MKFKITRFAGLLLIFLFLFGFVQMFVPTTEGQQGTLVVDRSYWLRLANNAWKYYQPGVGVNSSSGLHSASLGYPYFTDWDLGVYIQAIIDANQLGIISNSGTWGSDSRFNYVLTFLQTRQLSSNGLPYVWYQSANGKPYITDEQNAADSGQLLVALNNLRVFRPDLAGSINNIVFNRTNYAPLETAVDALTNSKNLYDYYVASGFAGFWPSRFSTLANTILNNIASAPTVLTYGISLPTSKLACEPLLLSVFNLATNAKLNGLADQVYSAQEARYTSTGKFTAFSEGNTGLSNPDYVYEWVAKDDGSTWTIEDVNHATVGISPIVFFKAAVGLLALHNTLFTEGMVSYIESHIPDPSNGYSDGVDESGRVVSINIDKTNGMIIGAALYAITNMQNPNSSPTPTPVPSSSSVSPTPSPHSSPSSSITTTPPPSGSSVSPTLSPTSSSSNSNAPSLESQLTNWGVLVFIAVLIVVCCVRFVQLTTSFGRKKSSEPLISVNCSHATKQHNSFLCFLAFAHLEHSLG